MSDPVKSPEHYQVLIGGVGVECKDLINSLGLDSYHWVAEAFSYIFRCTRKENFVQDIMKARECLSIYIDFVESNSKNVQP